MKNKIFIIIFSIFFFNNLTAENISITAKNITFDRNKNITIFEKEVVVKTKNKIIKSDYAEYFKDKGFLVVKENILAIDEKGNKIKTDYAEYIELDEILLTKGKTEVSTLENYILKGEDITVNNSDKIISSKKKSILFDQDKNKIFLENFEFLLEKSLFKSIGFIKIEDKNKNSYEFSQIYIDTKKKEILGSDTKAYLNQSALKINPKNKPRVFSNTMNINAEKSIFKKSVFTICDYRENDKCPPWTIQSNEMLHDNIKKTIYYKNAIIKVYNIPIFYFPKLSHPDPTVKRRSGFLPPQLYDTKNLGSGISIPYFFDLGIDKNFTLTNRLYVLENPLFFGEYNQAFKNSNLLADFGYTEGYKKSNSKKRKGDKSHFFSKFVKNFISRDGYKNTLELNAQNVSNDKYLKLYKIESNLVDYNNDNLENSIKFTQERENLFFGFNSSIYETLKDDYEDKYEYILPELTLDKNLISNENFGSLEVQTNYKVHNYDTNKFTNFLVNDFNYESNENILNQTINTKILANLKNINYETKNVNIYKDNPTSEIFGSVGILSEIKLEKLIENTKHLFKPKVLFRVAPGSMRKELSGSRLTPSSAFKMNRVGNINNYETGFTSAVGFDYKIKEDKLTKFDFSVAQIINEKENKKMSDKSSLNEKLSDIVGATKYQISENLDINYNFSIDQNFNEFNYNEIGANYSFGPLDVDFSYLKEKKHIGEQNYFKSEFNLKNNDNGILSFKTKQNLKTDSAEFYDLSYEYLNDCLRAGLVYRREFYKDSEIEPEDSLMFRITLVPFGNIDTPKLGK